VKGKNFPQKKKEKEELGQRRALVEYLSGKGISIPIGIMCVGIGCSSYVFFTQIERRVRCKRSKTEMAEKTKFVFLSQVYLVVAGVVIF
jgi:hypothetical protein